MAISVWFLNECKLNLFVIAKVCTEKLSVLELITISIWVYSVNLGSSNWTICLLPC